MRAVIFNGFFMLYEIGVWQVKKRDVSDGAGRLAIVIFMIAEVMDVGEWPHAISR